MSTQCRSSRPSMRTGFGPPAAESCASISSAIVRTSRVFDALAITNESVIDRTSPTSSTMGSVAFFDDAAPAARTAHRSLGLATAVPFCDLQILLRHEVLADDEREILRIRRGCPLDHLSQPERLLQPVRVVGERVVVIDDLRIRVIEAVGVAHDHHLSVHEYEMRRQLRLDVEGTDTAEQPHPHP